MSDFFSKYKGKTEKVDLDPKGKHYPTHDDPSAQEQKLARTKY